MTEAEEIDYWQSKFRILENYNIIYSDSTDYNCRSEHHIYKNESFLYSWGANSQNRAKDYIFHEIIHICMSCIRKSKKRREKEELFVQDLSVIMLEGEQKWKY